MSCAARAGLPSRTAPAAETRAREPGRVAVVGGQFQQVARRAGDQSTRQSDGAQPGPQAGNRGVQCGLRIGRRRLAPHHVCQSIHAQDCASVDGQRSEGTTQTHRADDHPRIVDGRFGCGGDGQFDRAEDSDEPDAAGGRFRACRPHGFPPPDLVEEWEIVWVHRAHTSHDGACVRAN